MNIADSITPPKAGLVQALTLVANTTSTAQDTDHPNSAGGSRYLSVICNAEFYILFTNNGESAVGNIPDPVIATTGVDGTVNGRCWGPLAAGQPHHFTVTGSERYFKAISVAGGILRWYLSSGQGS